MKSQLLGSLVIIPTQDLESKEKLIEPIQIKDIVFPENRKKFGLFDFLFTPLGNLKYDSLIDYLWQATSTFSSMFGKYFGLIFVYLGKSIK